MNSHKSVTAIFSQYDINKTVLAQLKEPPCYFFPSDHLRINYISWLLAQFTCFDYYIHYIYLHQRCYN